MSNSSLFRRVFDHAPEGTEVRDRLLELKQRSRRAMEYGIEFRTLAAESGWDDSALRAIFRKGLNSDILEPVGMMK